MSAPFKLRVVSDDQAGREAKSMGREGVDPRNPTPITYMISQNKKTVNRTMFSLYDKFLCFSPALVGEVVAVLLSGTRHLSK